MQSHNDQHHDNHEHSHFIVPLRVYYLTITGLLILTAITVGVSYINFGSTLMNLLVSMSIACVKASLVMMFFMGLKWDSNSNRVAILSTLVALATFVWLAASDLWYREEVKPVAVKKAAAAIGMDEIKKLEAEATPEQLAKGKEIYEQSCAACHGAEGKGDGIAGAALNPKPRNFSTPASTWTNGSSKKSIYVTLSEGVKNTGMAAFTSLSPAERFALVHFVRSISSEKQETGKADAQYTQVLEKVDGVGPNASAKESIPVDLAIELMVKDKNK